MAHEIYSFQPEESITLIRTKLNRPRLVGALVSQPRLLTWLECDPQPKLTLVSVPAGYGRMTLLVQWLEDCPHPTACLSLGEGDRDPAAFLSYFIAAICTAFPDACPATGMLLRAPQSSPLDHMAIVPINELSDPLFFRAGFRLNAHHGPLGNLAGVNRALIVTAYQSANGLLNLFTPTSAVVMGGLPLGRVGYSTWLKFVLPLLIILLVLYGLILSIGVLF